MWLIYIVLVDATRHGSKLEIWRNALEANKFLLSRTKTKYMEFQFSKRRNNDERVVRLDDQEIPKSENFRYLGLIIHKDGEIEKDMNYRLRAGWAQWRSATGVLCDHRIPIKLKRTFYRFVIRPAMLYGTECWAIKKQHIYKLSLAEMRMLRLIT